MRIGPQIPTSFCASFNNHHSANVNTLNKITTAKYPSQFAMPSPLPFNLTQCLTQHTGPSIAHYF